MLETVKMNIPLLEEDEVLFVQPDAPGIIFLGTFDHFIHNKLKDLNPSEVSWEQSIIMLNSGKEDVKYKLKKYDPLNESDVPVFLDPEWLVMED